MPAIHVSKVGQASYNNGVKRHVKPAINVSKVGQASYNNVVKRQVKPAINVSKAGHASYKCVTDIRLVVKITAQSVIWADTDTSRSENH